MNNEIQVFDSLEQGAFSYLESHYLKLNRKSYWKHVIPFKRFLEDNNYSLRFINFVNYYNHLDTMWRNNDIETTTFNCRLCSAKGAIKLLAKSSFNKDIVKRFHLKELLDDYKAKKVSSKFISKDRYLSPEEVYKVIEKISNKTVSLAVEFIFHTALRASELTNLKLSNLEKINDHYIITVHGKGGKEGKIPVSAEVVDKIKTHFDSTIWLFEHTYLKKKRKFNPLCLTNNMYKQTERILGKDKAKRIHSLRHSSLTYLFEKSNDLKKVSLFARHSSCGITADLYLHSAFEYDELKDYFEDF